MNEKYWSVISGLFGGAITSLFGGWSTGLATLCIIMAIDYITGFMVAAIFKSSPKTETGGLESRAGFKGLVRKFVMLLIVAVAYRIDTMTGSTFVKDAVTIAFTVNEGLSVLENAALMGIEIPILKDALELLRKKNEEREK